MVILILEASDRLAKRLAPNPLGIKSPDFGWGFFMFGLPRSGAWTRAESYAIEPPRFYSYGILEEG